MPVVHTIDMLQLHVVVGMSFIDQSALSTNLVIIHEGFDDIKDSRRHLVHLVKYEDVLFTSRHVA